MKILREIYDFITGGSVASPVGLVAAALSAYACMHFGVGPQATGFVFLAILGLTLAASVAEGAR